MIEIKHLRKEYGANVAIDNLNLEIPTGEVYGLIGPNGAGKTTLITILATLLEPTYGTAKVHGIDVRKEPLKVHRLIGYMSDVFALYENMRAWEYLDHFARCYGVDRRKRQGLIDQALELVDLQDRREADVKTLSRGMRQRLCFAKTLLHEPKVFLLDEPASGLDPKARVEFRELIKKLHDMGRTVLISSHILHEMADFCTSVGMFERGRLLATGKVADIVKQLNHGLGLSVEALDNPEGVAAILGRFPEAADIRGTPRGAVCRWMGDRSGLPALHRALVQADIPVVSFAAREGDLEDLYLRVTRQEAL